jgi:hypothetical protein
MGALFFIAARSACVSFNKERALKFIDGDGAEDRGFAKVHYWSVCRWSWTL